MKMYDKVLADSLEKGDIIKFADSFREIHSIEDFLTHLSVETDNGEEIEFQPDALVELYMAD